MELASLVAQLVKNLSTMLETWVRSLGWKDPVEKGKATYSSILAWRIPWTIVYGVQKSRTQVRDVHLHFQSTMIHQTADSSGNGISLGGRNDVPNSPNPVCWILGQSLVLSEPQSLVS